MTPPKNLVVIDVETTGTSLKRDEVTAIALVPVAHGGASFECYVQTPETKAKITGVAQKYFSRYARDWAQQAVSPHEATRRIATYLRSNDLTPATLIGHNVGFDLAFLKKMFEGADANLAGLVSHRAVDTHSLLHVLHTLGEIDQDVLTSDGAFRHFGIGAAGDRRHTALGDAVATRALYLALLERFQTLADVGLERSMIGG